MRTRLTVFISIVQSIFFLAHLFVYLSWSRFFGAPVRSLWVKLAFALLSVSFVLASLRGWYSFRPAVRVFYVLSAVWLGFASFFLWASCLTWALYGVALLIGLHWKLQTVALVLLACAMLSAVYGLCNAALPRVVRISVTLPNLPAQWRGRKAALVSDLHLGHIRNYRFVQRVVRKISALQPDIVFMAGDLYDGTAANFERLAQPWQALTRPAQSGSDRPLAVLYIPGNHEEFYRNEEYLPPLLKAGIRMLNNEKVELDGLQVTGVHYRDAHFAAQYQALLRGLRLDRDRASVLLLHAPVQLPISEAEGISLQLSGHTHGGQFLPWTWIARRVWGKFNHGLQSFGQMQVYVTYGVGTWGPPFRLATRPEIVLITFE
ncbi:MAG TPA: metallophosphoesterase [Candidatus Angelobacter sp.]|nr:metallophosphoesterase [Candidatus Angelobacter sp.]